MSRKTFFFFIITLLNLSVAAQQKIRIEINSLPANNPANSSIFIAGSFNSWNPQNKNFQFQKNEKGYFLELSLNAGSYEYKITRGGWDKVECTKEGKDVGNRTLKVDADANIEFQLKDGKICLHLHLSRKKVQPIKMFALLILLFLFHN